MTILRCANFKNEEKKLKKHYKEQRNLELILNHIKICQSFQELSASPISYMYGFEALKYEMSGYFSFNLCGKGGLIRLLCSVDENSNTIKLEFISMDHYEDFKKKF